MMVDLAEQIAARLRERPLFFADVVRSLEDVPWRDVLRAWGEVRRRFSLERDEDGHYSIPGAARPNRAATASSSRAAAKQPKPRRK